MCLLPASFHISVHQCSNAALHMLFQTGKYDKQHHLASDKWFTEDKPKTEILAAPVAAMRTMETLAMASRLRCHRLQRS